MVPVFAKISSAVANAPGHTRVEWKASITSPRKPVQGVLHSDPASPTEMPISRNFPDFSVKYSDTVPPTVPASPIAI